MGPPLPYPDLQGIRPGARIPAAPGRRGVTQSCHPAPQAAGTITLTQPPPDRFESIAAALAARVEAIVGAAEREAAAAQLDLVAQRREAEAEIRRYIAEVRARVEAQTEQRIDRLRRLTDGLVTRAEEARAQLEDLASELRRATLELEGERRMSAELFESPAPPAAAPAPPPVAAPDPAPPPPPPPPSPPAASGPLAPSPSPLAPPPWEQTVSVPAPPPAPEPAPAPEPEPEPAPAPFAGGEQPEDEPAPGGPANARVVAIQMAVAGASRGEVDSQLRERFGISDTTPILDDVFGESTDDSSRMSWG